MHTRQISNGKPNLGGICVQTHPPYFSSPDEKPTSSSHFAKFKPFNFFINFPSPPPPISPPSKPHHIQKPLLFSSLLFTPPPPKIVRWRRTASIPFHPPKDSCTCNTPPHLLLLFQTHLLSLRKSAPIPARNRPLPPPPPTVFPRRSASGLPTLSTPPHWLPRQRDSPGRRRRCRISTTSRLQMRTAQCWKRQRKPPAESRRKRKMG